VLSNNLANIETIGFKEDMAVFSNYISGDQNRITSTDPDSLTMDEPETLFPYLPVNTQVEFEGTKINFSQGRVRKTDNQLDLAIVGSGFFCVETLEGIQQYTRKGNFKLDEEEKLVTQDGFSVLGKNGGAIEISGQDIIIDEQGNIWVDGVNVNALKIVDFNQPDSLVKTGGTFFIPSDPSVTGIEAEESKISQGFIELSNVNPIKVMTEMIEVHRAFEAYQKIIRTLDEVTSTSINEVGKV
jgi:flagellar basal-body rod protein FlgG